MQPGSDDDPSGGWTEVSGGVPIAGFLLDRFQAVGQAAGQPNLGYTVIFTVAVVYFVLGTVFVRRIRGRGRVVGNAEQRLRRRIWRIWSRSSSAVVALRALLSCSSSTALDTSCPHRQEGIQY